MEAQTLPISNTEPDLSWGDFLVECPNCRQCAQVNTKTRGSKERYRILSCSSCGLAQRYHTNSTARTSSEIEGCFETRLWLNTLCGGRRIWAANENHLSYLENHLDQVSVGKNREEVKRGLSQLRHKLDSLH